MSAHIKTTLLAEKNFRWRAGETSRIEAFSDAVLAFAVTLLVVSLEVPKSFGELVLVMKGFVAFGICFTFLILVWKEHTIFFRRYGLQTPAIITLNSVLLFLVLFYVYPLKFLFGFLVGEFSGGWLSTAQSPEPVIHQNEVPALMIMYGLGLAAVYLVYSLMYLYAYRHRYTLELDEVETFMTRRSLYDQLALMAIALLSALLVVVLPMKVAGLSGLVYWLIPVYFTLAGMTLGRKQIHLIAQRDERLRAISASQNA